MLESMRCSRCTKDKPNTDFHWKIRNKRRQSACVVCYKTIHADWYQRNKRSAKERNKRLYRVALTWYRKQKAKPCLDCKRRFHFSAMDFDHARGNKVSNPIRMVQNCWSIERMTVELKKCDLVCANCHRIRTYRRRSSQAVRRTPAKRAFGGSNPPCASIPK